MTRFNTQEGNGEFRLQFETDDKDKFLYMQEKARRCVDNNMDEEVEQNRNAVDETERAYKYICESETNDLELIAAGLDRLKKNK